jgi:lipid-binding SYLF domain-containing protein
LRLVDAAGVFAGVSLDGYVTGPRSRRNLEHYGRQVSARDILLGNAVHKPEARVLSRALAPR